MRWSVRRQVEISVGRALESERREAHVGCRHRVVRGSERCRDGVECAGAEVSPVSSVDAVDERLERSDCLRRGERAVTRTADKDLA
jgi:hypothetical protein